MGFAGELATIGLPEVFQNVAFNRLTGTLTVTERDRSAAVLVESGAIRAFQGGPDRAFDYLSIAERSGAAPADVVASLRRRRRRRTLKVSLKRQQGFDEGLYDGAVSAAVEEEIIGLFSWRDASFVFEEGRPDEGVFDKEQLGCDIHLDPQAVAMEAARRLDEWETISRFVGTEREIYVAVDQEPGEDFTPEMLDLLRRLDGTRDLRALVEELGGARFHVLKMVAQLAESGWVVRADAEHLRELARRAQAAGEIKHAVRYIESALERESGDLESRRELVKLYEKAGRKSDAAREHKRIAYAEEERGDLDQALASYQRACVLVPSDTDTLEKILGIHDARGSKADFLKAGRKLAETCSAQGLHEEALEVYQRLLERDADSIALREAIAACYTKLHEPKQAAEQLLVLARRMWSRSDFERALHYYRNVLAVDRECEEATERIDEIESGRVRLKRRARRRRAVYACVSALVGLIVWQGVREWMAQEALYAASRAATSALAQDPSDKSLIASVKHYVQVAHSHPYTRSANQAVDAARALLLDELQRVQIALIRNPEAAETLLRQLAEIQFPEELLSLWHDERDRLLAEIAKRR